MKGQTEAETTTIVPLSKAHKPELLERDAWTDVSTKISTKVINLLVKSINIAQ